MVYSIHKFPSLYGRVRKTEYYYFVRLLHHFIHFNAIVEKYSESRGWSFNIHIFEVWASIEMNILHFRLSHHRFLPLESFNMYVILGLKELSLK